MGKQFAITVLGLGIAVSPIAAADIVGAGASVGYWNSELTGQASKGNDLVDIEDDLDLDRSDNVQIRAALEHPVPLLPNAGVGFTRLDQSGEGRLGTSFGSVDTGLQVRSELNLDLIDLTLYYELLDNWVNLDAGLTFRALDGELLVEERANPANATRAEIKAVLPLGYVAARFDVPVTGLSFGATGHGIAFDGDSLFDITAYGQYDLSVLRLQAGYRQLSLDVEDGSDSLDVEIGGPFISAGLDF